MANTLDIRMKAEGIDEVRNALDGVRKSVKARILKSAVAYAIKPMVPATKSAVPRKFGTLAKSIISRVKRYTKGEDAVVVALVGPEAKYKETVTGSIPFMGPRNGVSREQKPSKYAHLVEHGTKAHFIPAPGFGRKAQKTKAQFGMKSTPGWTHPGAKAHPFLKPTAERMQSTVVERMRDQVLKRVKIEYDRAVKKGKKFWSTDR